MSDSIHNKVLKLEKLLKTKEESFWVRRGEKSVIKNFNKTKKVSAYRHFLKENLGRIPLIKTIKDFKKIPPTDKNNYLKKYPYRELFYNGKFTEKHWVISSTSGSTGEPFYFPRTSDQDKQYALTAELYLLTNFKIDKRTTLYINGFAMGVWIGGLFTYQAIKHVAENNNYKLSIINPGINKEEILKAVKKLGDHFDQIIIGGYPPFIKDLIDYGDENNINWEKWSVKFIFSAEGFSEDFRDYITVKAKLKNPYTDTLNHYGTVDLGTMSYETPIAILLRRIALKNPDLFESLFKQAYRLPTVTQHIPEHFYFEEINGGLFCTSDSGLPLIRYDLKDKGGIVSFKEMIEICKKHKVDILLEAKKVKIAETIWKIPFVYLYERTDMAVVFYGANIYPETIRKVLIHGSFNKIFTGKCTLEIRYTKKHDQVLVINIELKKGIFENQKIKNDLQEKIVQTLVRENSEYRNNYRELGKKSVPKILLWSYGHSNYFKSEGKQKWVIKK